ncbi:MAG: ATP phosphoribosyltransferase regulatory subunit [Pseudomonadota bacterium]
MRNWLLPEHVEDVLPPEAEQVEALRSRLLALFRGHGYRTVIPPMLEFVDSLRVGTGIDLDLRTVKVADQLSGRLMGLRADITPQVARIDAYRAPRTGVARYAYCGSVLHARPASGSARRELLQLGAELFGHGGVASDIEVQRLMLEALRAAGLGGIHLDLGHVGVFRALVAGAGVEATLEAELFEALQRKDEPLVASLTGSLPEPWRAALRRLPRLYGDEGVLAEARACLPREPALLSALDALEAIAQATREAATLHVDLAELRGYRYHTGVVFAAYTASHPSAVAAGGRYDELGAAFGRARPATGFSLDLFALSALVGPQAQSGVILAPGGQAAGLADAIAALRAAGEKVVVDLGDGVPEGAGVDRRLVASKGGWRVESLPAQR